CPKAEMEETVGARKGERSSDQTGYRSGYYSRGPVTRVGKLELRVPQDWQGRLTTEVFERYQRSEKVMVARLSEMYVQNLKCYAWAETLSGSIPNAKSCMRTNSPSRPCKTEPRPMCRLQRATRISAAVRRPAKRNVPR